MRPSATRSQVDDSTLLRRLRAGLLAALPAVAVQERVEVQVSPEAQPVEGSTRLARSVPRADVSVQTASIGAAAGVADDARHRYQRAARRQGGEPARAVFGEGAAAAAQGRRQRVGREQHGAERAAAAE